MSMVIIFFQYHYEYKFKRFNRKYNILVILNTDDMVCFNTWKRMNKATKYFIIILLTMFITTLYHDETTPPCTPYYNDDGDIVWQQPENYWE